MTEAQLAEKAAAKAARRAHKKAEKKVLQCLHDCARVFMCMYVRRMLAAAAGSCCPTYMQSAKQAAKRSVLRLSGLDKPIPARQQGHKQANVSGKSSGTTAPRQPERRLSAAPQRDTGFGTPGTTLSPGFVALKPCCDNNLSLQAGVP